MYLLNYPRKAVNPRIREDLEASKLEHQSHYMAISSTETSSMNKLALATPIELKD